MNRAWTNFFFGISLILLRENGRHTVGANSQLVYRAPQSLITVDNQTRVGDIVLGGLFPIHQNEEDSCGRILDLGIQRAEAMVLAMDIINRDPTLLPGLTLGVEIRDTCAVTNQALDQSLTFLSVPTLDLGVSSKGVCGVVGAAASGVSIAVANLLRLFNIPQVSYASTSKQLSDKSRYDYFLRTVPPDRLQAKAMAAIAHHFNWTYISLVSTEGAYGRDGINAFVEEYTDSDNASDAKRCVAADIELSLSASEIDYENAVDDLVQPVISNATVVVLFGQLATAEGMMKALQKKKREDPSFSNVSFTWIASDAWADSLPNQYFDAVGGLLGVSPIYHLSREFDMYFTALNPLAFSGNPWFHEYWENIFDCSFDNANQNKTMCDAASQSLMSPDSGYQQNSKVTFTMDAVFAFAHALHSMIMTNCNASVLCAAVIDGNGQLNGQMLLEHLKTVSFMGFSADLISFDQNGDQRGGYLIRSLAQDTDYAYSFRTVGIWQDDVLDLFDEQNITWSSPDSPRSYCSEACRHGEYPKPIEGQADCCWICTPCQGIKQISDGLVCLTCPKGYLPSKGLDKCEPIPPDYLSWLHPWAVIIMFLSLVGCCVTLVTIIIFIVKRNAKLLKATSRELSGIILFGVFCCYALPFFYIGKPLPFSCAVTRFGLGFGFSICFGALLVKTNRIHRIFNRQQKTLKPPPFISPQSQVVFVAAIVFFQVLIAVVWLIFEQPGTILVMADYSAESRCAANVYAGLSVSLAYNCILLICSTYFAFRTRSVPSEFNETKLVNLTCYTMCVIWLAFIPSYFGTASLGSVYTTSSQVLAIVLSASCLLGILFIPKLYVLYRQSKNPDEADKHDRQHSMSTTNCNQSTNNLTYSVTNINQIGSLDGNSSRRSSLPLSATGLIRKPYSDSDSGVLNEDSYCLDERRPSISASVQLATVIETDYQNTFREAMATTHAVSTAVQTSPSLYQLETTLASVENVTVDDEEEKKSREEETVVVVDDDKVSISSADARVEDLGFTEHVEESI